MYAQTEPCTAPLRRRSGVLARASMEHRLEATGDEVFAPLVHEGWTDRIHGAPVRTGPDPVLTCAFKS
jgi:hypothetical protein